MVIDSENYNIKCKESYTDTNSFIYKGITERVYYVLDKEILKKICDSKSFKVRISGRDTYVDLSVQNCLQLIVLCKMFYNEYYDENSYTEILNQSKGKKKNQFSSLLWIIIIATVGWLFWHFVINRNKISSENVIQPDIPTQDTITSSKKNTTTKKKKSNIQSRLIIGTWKTECTVDGIVKKTMTFYDDGTVKMETDDGELQEGKWQMANG